MSLIRIHDSVTRRGPIQVHVQLEAAALFDKFLNKNMRGATSV
jgi:hypothetical protein